VVVVVCVCGGGGGIFNLIFIITAWFAASASLTGVPFPYDKIMRKSQSFTLSDHRLEFSIARGYTVPYSRKHLWSALSLNQSQKVLLVLAGGSNSSC